MSDGFVLKLTTSRREKKRFTIDEEAYELYGMEHLSDQEEARAVSLLERHQTLAMGIGSARSQHEGENMAKRMRTMRIDILTTLTSVPRDVVEKLPLPEQIELLDAVRLEMDPESDDGDGGAEE